ncbi:YybH family protein [Kordiimonas laminariae]|uniref:YybH family protein n=1 Tax=Kordiimonas laminariae TaxID=2917717 RepID=UPI001FF44168|nr:nuclear transport factor 2 family protein [Kordiimonas laminariae]MCK0070821.1 DUF4440 domain-containing protein [Kordiimonas laminariae]
MSKFLTAGLLGLFLMLTPTVQADDKDIIRGKMQAWLDAYNTKDISALMALYGDRIYYANNGSDLVTSIEQIRANYGAQFKAGGGATVEFSEELVTVGEKLAHIAGKYRVNIPQGDGKAQSFYGRVLLIFEKQTDEWKLVVDFDNQGKNLSAENFH